MPYSVARIFISIALVSLLAACGDSNDSDSATPINITPSLGRIQNAGVRILDLDEVPIADVTGTLSASGSVELDLPSDFDQPFIVEVLGNSAATYFDEASGTDLPFPQGEVLRAVVSGPQDEVGVTPLTNIAASRALSTGAATAEDVDAANEDVRQEFLPGVADITLPPTLIDDVDDTAGVDSDADLYALFLATLSELSASESVSLLDLVDQLSEDFVDGALDGNANGAALTTSVIDTETSDFEDEFEAALTDAVTSYGEAGITVEDVADGFEEDTTGNGGGGDSARICAIGTAADAALPSSLSSQVLDFDVDFIAAGTAFGTSAVGDTLVYTFSGSGALFVENVEFSADPYVCGDSSEINWYNETDEQLYSISFTANDEINELNFSQGDPLVFTAQLIPAAGDSGNGDVPNLNLVTAAAGTYNVDGAIGGTHTRGTVTIGADGSVDFDTGTSFTAQSIDSISFFDSEPRIQISYGDSTDAEVINIVLDTSDFTDVKSVQYLNPAQTIDINALIEDDTVASFTLSGTITNAESLTGQWELRIGGTFANDGGMTAGTVTYQTEVTDGATYEVIPSNTDCTVTNGSGTVSANIDNIDISCATPVATTYSISGTITNGDALTGQWELFLATTLSNDGGLTAGAVTYSATVADGVAFEVLASNPECVVTNGTGTISGADVTGVDIACTSGSTGGTTTSLLPGFPEAGFKPVEPTNIPTVTPRIGVDIRAQIPALYADATEEQSTVLFSDQEVANTEITYSGSGAEYLYVEYTEFQVPVRTIKYSSGADGMPNTMDDIPLAYSVSDMSLFDPLLFNPVPTYVAEGPGEDDLWFTDDDFFVEYPDALQASPVFYLESAVVDNNYLVAGSITGRSTIGLDPGDDGILFTADDDLGSNSFVFPYQVITVSETDSAGQGVIFDGYGDDDQWFTSDDDIQSYSVAQSNSAGTEVGAIVYGDEGTDSLWFTDDDEVLLYTAIVLDADNRPEYVLTYQSAGADSQWFTTDDPISSYTYYGYDDNGEPSFVATHTSKGADDTWFTSDDSAAATVASYDDEGRILISMSISGIGADNTWLTADDELSYYQNEIYTDSGLPLATGGSFAAGEDGLWFTDDDLASGFRQVYEYDDLEREIYRSSYSNGIQGQVQVRSYLEDGSFLSATINAAGDDGIFGTQDDVAQFASQVEITDGSIVAQATLNMPGSDALWFTDDDIYSRYFTKDGDLFVFYEVGDDGQVFTADDSMTGYQDATVNGDITTYTSYSAAGDDGIWMTADDIVSAYSEAILDVEGRTLESIPYSAGTDGIFGTSDDEATYRSFYEYDAAGNSIVEGTDYYSLDVTFYSAYTYDAEGNVLNSFDYNSNFGSLGEDGIMPSADDIPTGAVIRDVSASFVATTSGNTGFAPVACDITTGVSGSISVAVVNAFGEPVQDAILMLGSGGTTATTGTDGLASFSSVMGPQDLHVMKDDYAWESFYCVEPTLDGTAITSVIHPMDAEISSALALPNTFYGNDLVVMLDQNGELIATNVGFSGSNSQAVVDTFAYSRPAFFSSSLDPTLHFVGVAPGTSVTGDIWALQVGNSDFFTDAVLVHDDATFTTVEEGDSSAPIELSISYPGMTLLETIRCSSCGTLRWSNAIGMEDSYNSSIFSFAYSYPDNLPDSFIFADIVTNNSGFSNNLAKVVTALEPGEDIASAIPNPSQLLRTGRFPDQDTMGLPAPVISWDTIRQIGTDNWYVGQSMSLSGSTQDWNIHLPAGLESVELPSLPSAITDTLLDQFFEVEQIYRTNGGSGYQNWIQTDDFRTAPTGEDFEEVRITNGRYTR